MAAHIEIAVFRKRKGVLSKRIWLDDDGRVCSDGSACRMAAGKAERVKLNGVDSLAELIEDMPAYEALTLGRLRANLPDKVNVVLARELDERTPPDTIARTGEYLHYAPGQPAYLLLDHDNKGQPRAVGAKLKAAGGFWKAVVAAVPALAKAGHVWRRSTSAGLYSEYKPDQWLRRSAGEHIYVTVSDGSDIERALKTLHERLWLAGLGYYVVSAAGQLLDRSIIDAAVYGPERLVFEGAPILEPPVAQDRKERRPVAHDGELIDTAKALPALNKAELASLATLNAAARESLKPQVAVARKAWAKEFAAQHGISEKEAEKIATAATRYTLQPEFDLEFDELGPCTVADVTADPDKFVSATLADPLEGVIYGRGKAKVFRRANGEVMINSFAHGGIKYQLVGQGVGLEDFYASMENHNYFYVPTRQPWPATSVNARIGPVPLVDSNGNPLIDEKGKQRTLPANVWLDQNRPVEQITWVPGLPVLIKDRLVFEGGWIKRAGVHGLNLYRPPDIELGNGRTVDPWLEHLLAIYPVEEEANHIVSWLAHRVQHPEDKINHALVLGGGQGIGKDTLLEPVKDAVGRWNFREVAPHNIMGRFNEFYRSVILRVSEARDLGDYDRYKFYEKMKFIAAPPDVLRVDEKNLREYYIPNLCSVIITTNHKTAGLYLPSEDRRHFVVWSERKKEDFTTDYWNKLWRWYDSGGNRDVAAYLSKVPLDDFNPKAVPPRTPAFWAIVDAGGAPEDAELADALEALRSKEEKERDDIGPPAVTLDDVIDAVPLGNAAFGEWLRDRKNRRIIPHRFEQCGYVAVRNEGAKDGRWKVDGQRKTVYARKDLTPAKQMAAVKKRVAGT
jgi:hypothetical protein